jgi:hypothetical protein
VRRKVWNRVWKKQDCKGVLFGVQWHPKGVLNAISRRSLLQCDQRPLLRNNVFQQYPLLVLPNNDLSCRLPAAIGKTRQTWAGPQGVLPSCQGAKTYKRMKFQVPTATRMNTAVFLGCCALWFGWNWPSCQRHLLPSSGLSSCVMKTVKHYWNVGQFLPDDRALQSAAVSGTTSARPVASPAACHVSLTHMTLGLVR